MGTDAVEHACTQSKKGVVHTVQRASGAPRSRPSRRLERLTTVPASSVVRGGATERREYRHKAGMWVGKRSST